MLYIGAHVSAAGKVGNSIKNAQDIGANAFALFVRPQRTWTAKPMKQEDIEDFKLSLKQSGIESNKVVPHGSYLINLGNPNSEKRDQSFQLFKDEAERCYKLGIPFYNIHPGSTVGECSIEESASFISEEINKLHAQIPDICILLENAAGQGNSVGSKFEELKMIINKVSDKKRVGVTIDTCHLFAAGYDIRSEKAYAKTMAELNSKIGFEYLKAFHINDSKGELGCGKDRHENIGKGCLGLNAFKNIINDSNLEGIPLILETPESSPDIYAKEIEILRGLQKE
jgi:apurinic endonuclease APN1